MLFTNTINTDASSIGDPTDFWIAIISSFSFKLKVSLNPFIWLSKESRTWSSPNVHPEKVSPSIESTVIWNSLNVLLISVGIPAIPPTSKVRISPFWYPYPTDVSSKFNILDPPLTTTFTLAPDPIPCCGESLLYESSRLLYESGWSKNTIGAFVDVYPDPAFVMATPVTIPSVRIAVPIATLLYVPVVELATETLTVWMPDLYPDPLFPIEMDETVPNPEIIAVPPADTSGWYANPSVDATETMRPPTGIAELLGSYGCETPIPVKLIVVADPTSLSL